MNEKQVQKAGDNAQQIQGQTINIYNGVSEERVRAICSEVAQQVIVTNTLEAAHEAQKRIDRFVDLLLPRIQQVEENFASFSDPAFQALLRKAQLTAVCTEKGSDYEVLSELLVHRIKNRSNIKKKASITKAIEIIDQIDDDSLCALTMIHAIRSFIPRSGKISEGIEVLSTLYDKLTPKDLPKDNLWIDNLSILGAIISPQIYTRHKFEDFLGEKLNGYVCAGIKKDSSQYVNVIKLLEAEDLPADSLIDNELLEGYVRLAVSSKAGIDDLEIKTIYPTRGMGMYACTASQKVNERQRKCLHSIFDIYATDVALKKQVKENFTKVINSYEPMKQSSLWWNCLSTTFKLTSIGKTIAHANAKRIDSTLPNLD